MKKQIVLLLLFCTTLCFAQKDIFHKFKRNSYWFYALGLKSAGNNKAILFTIDNYFNSPLDSIASTIYKVDYCGEIDTTITVTMPDYNKIMFFDLIYTDSTYIFMATATDIIQNRSYFLTIKSDVNLQGFEIIDSMEIDYPHFGLIYHNTIINENTLNHELVFTIGLGFNKEKEAVHVEINPIGKIKNLTVLNLSDHYFYDHYYNSSLKKHYIISGSLLYVLDEDFNLISETDIYVKLNNIDKFNFDYRIIFGSDDYVTLIGRWPDSRICYSYKVKIKESGTFDPLEYNPNIFPMQKTYVLRKQYNKDKIVISYSTDDLDTPSDVPNANYLWEIDKSGTISKEYKIQDNIKRSLEITDIDADGNLLGTGYEYKDDNNIFFILTEDNRFLVNSEDTKGNNPSFKLFPNPVNQLLTIGNPDQFEHNASIYSIDGFKTKVELNNGSVDVSHLLPGLYFLELTLVSSQSSLKRKFMKVD
ncbi:MAG: T9SS type A sorting domain-containing protein [Saprospiraceae bacterium]|jgi:hypothetical protein|nr:T9SS type A sorting domain-containing protein [Saprospiraceae bacterium]